MASQSRAVKDKMYSSCKKRKSSSSKGGEKKLKFMDANTSKKLKIKSY